MAGIDVGGIGNLADFDPAADRVELVDDDRKSLDWWAMAKLSELVSKVHSGYRTYQFKRVVEAVFDFCIDTMSSVYMAAVKDRLYCDPVDGRRRRRTQTVLSDTASALIRLAAPILVHTADEAYLAIRAKIIEDEVPFGGRLHIGNLAEELGVEPSGAAGGQGGGDAERAAFSVLLGDVDPSERLWLVILRIQLLGLSPLLRGGLYRVKPQLFSLAC